MYLIFTLLILVANVRSEEGHSGAAESTIVVALHAIYHLLLTDGEDPISQLYVDTCDSFQIE